MKQYHKPYSKKVGSGSGGRRRKGKDKKLAHIGGVFASTHVAAADYRTELRTRGGNIRQKLKKAALVNVVMKDGKHVKAKVLRVVESHNSEYVRSNIITRGAVVETDIGKVRITNRVGQDGVVNGIQL